MTCSVKHEEGAGQSLSLLVRFEDKMNRQLSCKVGDGETSLDLANELVHYGLVSEVSSLIFFILIPNMVMLLPNMDTNAVPIIFVIFN